MLTRMRKLFRSIVVNGDLFFAAIGCALTYVVFSLVLAYKEMIPKNQQAFISTNPEHWGQFGDYMGGILNPVVALAALLMLILSVSIQRMELADTREQLDESKRAQQEQIRMQLLSAKIAAKNLLYNHFLEFENRANGSLKILMHAPAMAKTEDGAPIDLRDVETEITRLIGEIKVSKEERQKLVIDIQDLVKSVATDDQDIPREA